jgi:hypothetical protein
VCDVISVVTEFMVRQKHATRCPRFLLVLP